MCVCVRAYTHMIAHSHTPAFVAREENGEEIPSVIFNLLSLKVLYVIQIEIFHK